MTDNTGKIKKGKWQYWDRWASNHDLRIDGATCSVCGWVHPTVRPKNCYENPYTPDLLYGYCPNCGAKMD